MSYSEISKICEESRSEDQVVAEVNQEGELINDIDEIRKVRKESELLK